MSPDVAIAIVAACQYGAFTHAQARTAGFTNDGIRHRIRSGRWIVLHRGVYAIAGTPRTRDQAIFAAVASFGPRAAAAGRTAAEVLKLVERPERGLEVALPPGQHRAARDGIVVHQYMLFRSDIRTERSIRVTAPNRTLVDYASVASPSQLEEALDTALFRGFTSASALSRYVVNRNLIRQSGVSRLRRMLDDRVDGSSHSKLERIFFEKVTASRLPLPVRQYRVGNDYIDIAYPAQRLVIELDRRGSRFTAAAQREHLRRQNEVVLALPGWTLLRFTWHDVVDDWPFVERTLRRVLG